MRDESCSAGPPKLGCRLALDILRPSCLCYLICQSHRRRAEEDVGGLGWSRSLLILGWSVSSWGFF